MWKGHGDRPSFERPHLPVFRWHAGHGANNCHRDVINGGLYEVVGLNPMRLRDEEIKAELVLTPEEVARHTRLRWAVAYPSIQGWTLCGTVAL